MIHHHRKKSKKNVKGKNGGKSVPTNIPMSQRKLPPENSPPPLPLPSVAPPESPAAASLSSLAALTAITGTSTLIGTVSCGILNSPTSTNIANLSASVFADPLVTKLKTGWKCVRCDYVCKSNEAKRLLGHLLKKKGFKVKPCKAVIEPNDHIKYQLQLGRITQTATVRKRTHERLSACVDEHQDELVDDLIESRQSRNSVSSAASSRSRSWSVFFLLSFIFLTIH